MMGSAADKRAYTTRDRNQRQYTPPDQDDIKGRHHDGHNTTNETSLLLGTIQQQQNTTQDARIDIRVPFQSLAVTTATTQISSLVFCLAWSVKFNFYESTATHCRVDNYLPSLSATLDFTPQRDVWRSCIGLSGVPRYLIAYLYYEIIYKSKLLLALHWLEISALIGLSIVDSIRYFSFHAVCVGIFLLTSIVHMTLVCRNYISPRNISQLSETTRKNFQSTKRIKKRIAMINFTAIVTALYLYDRHNRLCEPGVYSMFSFLEYIVIVANIIYHLQAYHDLGEYSILVARFEQSLDKQQQEREGPDNNNNNNNNNNNGNEDNNKSAHFNRLKLD